MNNKTITAQERKNRSIAILQAQKVPYIEHLPFRYETEEVTPRDKKEVIERAVCSFASIMCALSISKGEYSQEDRVSFGKIQCPRVANSYGTAGDCRYYK